MTTPPKITIAVTTNDLVRVDSGFLTARQFVLYDVGYEDAVFVDCVQFGASAGASDAGGAKTGRGPGGGQGCSMGDMASGSSAERIAQRVAALEGCSVLFTCTLNDVQAVAVHHANVFPVKLERPRSIAETIEHLQRMMRVRPPLWLRRAMGTLLVTQSPDELSDVV